MIAEKTSDCKKGGAASRALPLESASAVANKITSWYVISYSYSAKSETFRENSYYLTLCEKCPNTEIFLVRIFPYSDGIDVFSPYTGKYGPEKTPHLNTFHVVSLFREF